VKRTLHKIHYPSYGQGGKSRRKDCPSSKNTVSTPPLTSGATTPASAKSPDGLSTELRQTARPAIPRQDAHARQTVCARCIRLSDDRRPRAARAQRGPGPSAARRGARPIEEAPSAVLFTCGGLGGRLHCGLSAEVGCRFGSQGPRLLRQDEVGNDAGERGGMASRPASRGTLSKADLCKVRVTACVLRRIRSPHISLRTVVSAEPRESRRQVEGEDRAMPARRGRSGRLPPPARRQAKR